MSVVTGTGGGVGGSTAFFSSFLATTNKTAPGQPVSGSVSGTVGGTTLSTPVIPSHTHTCRASEGSGNNPDVFEFGSPPEQSGTQTSSATGGGGSHSHPFSGSLSSATADVTIPAANVKYANVIIATKD